MKGNIQSINGVTMREIAYEDLMKTRATLIQLPTLQWKLMNLRKMGQKKTRKASENLKER